MDTLDIMPSMLQADELTRGWGEDDHLLEGDDLSQEIVELIEEG